MWCFLCISFKLGSSGPKGRVEIRSPCFSPLWSRFSFIAGPFPYKLLSQIAAIKDTFGLIFQTLFHFSWSCTNCILEEVLMTIPLPAITWDRRKEHTFCWTVMWNGRGARGGQTMYVKNAQGEGVVSMNLCSFHCYKGKTLAMWWLYWEFSL